MRIPRCARASLPTTLSLALTGALTLNACKPAAEKPADTAASKAEVKAEAPKLDRVKRMDFNRIAAELALPLFWVEDADTNGIVGPGEVATFWALRPTTKAEWVASGAFTPAFLAAYEQIATVAAKGHDATGLDAAEAKRRELVRRELAQGRQTIVESDFASASAEDKAIVTNILAAAEIIEKIYAKQRGSFGLAEQIPANDPSSKMMFARNQAPWCVAPETENDPDCSALASKPAKISGLYPAIVQSDPKFCDTLAARKDGEKLMHQFHVVREKDGDLAAVPYTVEYEAEMKQISELLTKAASAITSETEAAFKAYLTAAAQSFLTNDWEPADEAWSKMNVGNSKWYLRIGPDEVYFEPCSRKAGFHVSFARINQASVEWQTLLDPLKNDLEGALAKLAGPPYKARKVDFHLPDFIDIIVNAGDSRDEHGATIGQSLPNWGPVANEGRGRTVAMTNFYTDADSKAALRAQTESLFCKASMATYSDDYGPQLMSTVLHEAAHNLGPAHEYKVKGQTDDQAFGGPLASMLEELKSQTAAGFYTDWLANQGKITKEQADKAHTRDVVWAFGHISRGMYVDGKVRPYSQLAAVQVSYLVKEGAMTWKADEKAANGSDAGCFELDLAKFPGAFEGLMKTVGGIKARADKKAALELQKQLVDAPDATERHKVITERWLRSPKASFVYSVEL
ncbi:hypothetical protein L6R52_29705 [Myxococcota bacterium]|nr:hypothetical protein [Myxococcota bacterium]